MSIGGFLGRAALAVGTGGLSELGGARTLNDASKYVGGPDLAGAVGLSKPPALATAGNEISENDRRRAEFAQKLNDYQNRTAPQLGPAAQVNTPQLAPQQRAELPQMPTPQQVPGTVSYGSREALTTPVEKARIGDIASYKPANPGNAQQASSAGAIAQQVGGGQQARTEQGQANALLAGAAAGTAPSVAQEQLQSGMDKTIASNYALARSAHGAGRVAALENAQGQQEQAGAQLSQQQAELRASEMAQNRNNYAQAIAQQRGQDIGAETTNAQLGTQVSEGNAGRETSTSVANMQQGNQFALTKAQMDQQARQDYAQALNNRTMQQGQLDANANNLGAQLGTNVSLANAGNTNEMNKFNSGQYTQNEQFKANLDAQRQQYAAGLQGQIGMFNAGQGNQMNEFGANLQGDIGKFNAGQTNQQTQAQADFTTRWAQMDDNQKAAYLNYLSNSQEQSIRGANDLAGAQEKQNAQRWGQVQDLANAGAGLAGKKAVF